MIIKVFIYLLFCCLIKEVSSWCLKQTIIRGTSSVNDLDYSSITTGLLAVGRTQAVYIYNQTTFQLKSVISVPGKNVKSVSFSKNNNIFAIGYSNQNIVRIYRTNTIPFTSINNVTLNIASINSVHVSIDGSRIIACGPSTRFTIISDPFTQANAVQYESSSVGSSQPAYNCKFTGGNNNKFALAFSNAVLYYSNLGTGNIWNNKACNSLDWRTNGGNILAACRDSRGYMIENNAITTVVTDSNDLLTVSYSKDSTIFFMAGKDSRGFFFYNNLTLRSNFSRLSGQILSSSFDQNSSSLVAGSSTGLIYLFQKDCMYKCQPNFFMENRICVLCSQAIPYCYECKSRTQCLTCVAGFYLNSTTKCAPCTLIGCIICNQNNTQCLACEKGSFLNTVSKLCQQCTVYSPYCQSCNASSYCLRCDIIAHFETDTNKCKLCNETMPRCLWCENSSTCLLCQEGFRLLTGSSGCQKCADNCTTCLDSGVCIQCVRGYYLNSSNNSCTKCSVTGCINCNNKNQCIQCEEGKYLNTTVSCVQCSIPCASCNKTTGKCFSCVSGYYFKSSTFQCLKCDKLCESCTNAGTCLTCLTGYALNTTSNNNTCANCLNLYNQCTQCNSTKCFQCRQGYYFDVTSQICTSCTKSISNCISCADTSTCNQCLVGFYHTTLSANLSCDSCPIGCAKCISLTNCTSCLPQYYFNANKCLACVAPCITCTDLAICLSCAHGFYLQTNGTCSICNKNIPRCQDCYNSSYCIGCQLNYYLQPVNKNQCILCSYKCTKCQNSSFCHSCQLGYYLDTSNVCQLCKIQCSKCISATQCISCNNGYYLETNLSCSKCSINNANCINCKSSTECLKCTSGTILDSNATSLTFGKCLYCQNKISNCILCDQKTGQCTQCLYSYGLSLNKLTCNKCSDSLSQCLHCQKENKCLSCKKGFFLFNNGTTDICKACSSKACISCNSTVCFTCIENYYMSSTSSCVSCQNNIQGCNTCSNSTNTVICNDCFKEYYLETSTKCTLCSQTIFGCSYCAKTVSTSSLKCLLCQMGFTLNSSDNKCYQCTSTLQGCQLCSTTTNCIQCENGYYLNLTTSKCNLCSNISKQCISCKNNTHCLNCEKSSFLDTTNNNCQSCQITLEGCIYCLSDSVCLQCNSGYYLNSGTNKCQKCQQKGCQVCNKNDPLKCIACNSMYTLNPSTFKCSLCNEILPGCFDCTNSTGTLQCKNCVIGFFKNSTEKCQLCSSKITGCMRCNSEIECIECQSLYLMNTNASGTFCNLCSQFIQNCQVCSNNSSCIACQVSYFLYNNNQACQFCPNLINNCIYCQSRNNCVLCQTSYYISGGICNLCSNSIKGCYSCINQFFCTSCKNGYSYNANSNTCDQITLFSQSLPNGKLQLYTYYMNPTILKHILYSPLTKFNKSAQNNFNLSNVVKLSLKDKSNNIILLIVTSYQFSSNQNYVTFYTNNPLNLNQILKKDKGSFSMPIRRLQQNVRLLTSQAFQIDIDSTLDMPSQVALTIMPNLDYTSDVSISYSLNSPQFYKSVVQNGEYLNNNFMYFGYCILIILFINFSVKVLFTSPKSIHIGQIFSHVVALKTICISVYPCFLQTLSFGKGFMLFDFPWANNIISKYLASNLDYAPQSYKLIYQNINIGATFSLPLIILIFIAIYGSIILTNVKQSEEKQQQIRSQEQVIDKSPTLQLLKQEQNPRKLKFYTFWSYIFGFGLVQAGFCSFLGALYNYLNGIDVNFGFYIVGSIIYFIILTKLIHLLYKNIQENIKFVRIFLKATILSFAYKSPLYISIFVVLLDISLFLIEYKYYLLKLNKKNKQNSINFESINGKNDYQDNNKNNRSININYLWLINNFLINLTLFIVFLFNDRFINIIFSGVFLVIILLIQIIIHFKQYCIHRQKLKINGVRNKQNQFQKNKLFNDTQQFNFDKIQNKFNDQKNDIIYDTNESFIYNFKQSNSQLDLFSSSEKIERKRKKKNNRSPSNSLIKQKIKQQANFYLDL